MIITPTKIPDVKLIEPDIFGDDRGFFMETWHREKFDEAGIDVDFVQDNQSRSNQGTLRGLHYQIKQPQGKLVRVTMGEVFDVAVDIRRNSPTFGQWVGEYLSGNNKRMLWIPIGFAHGFYVTSDYADFLYKCTDYYAPEHERSILWNDVTIAVKWPIRGGDPKLSMKDQMGQIFLDAELF
jgi:dTDP-4-dehydrorhamnose 3,5-epimerase